MNRSQFLRVLRRHCKANDLPAPVFDPTHGKGGHGEISVGRRFTTIPSGELRPATKEAILKQLGLSKGAV